jgi:hypothetical protein
LGAISKRLVETLMEAQRSSKLPLVPERTERNAGSRTGLRPNMNRVEGKRHRVLLKAAEDYNQRAVYAQDGIPNHDEVKYLPQKTSAGAPALPDPPPPGLDRQEWAAAANAVAAACRARADRIQAFASRRVAGAGGRSFRSRLSSNRKDTTRALFSTGDPESLTEVNIPGGGTSGDPAVVISAVDGYFTDLQTPISEVDLTSVPWEGDLDPYTTAQPSSPPARLGDRITRDLVAATIARIPKRRTPGPDGLLGETLRCAPSAVVDLIGRLQLAYWDGGYLPTHLKESVTTLIHKWVTPVNRVTTDPSHWLTPSPRQTTCGPNHPR